MAMCMHLYLERFAVLWGPVPGQAGRYNFKQDNEGRLEFNIEERAAASTFINDCVKP